MEKVSALDHKVFDDPMKCTSLVALRHTADFVLSSAELTKVLGRLGNDVGKELKLDSPG